MVEEQQAKDKKRVQLQRQQMQEAKEKKQALGLWGEDDEEALLKVCVCVRVSGIVFFSVDQRKVHTNECIMFSSCSSQFQPSPALCVCREMKCVRRCLAP